MIELIEQGNWREAYARPGRAMRLFYRLRRWGRRQVTLMRWAREQQAYEIEVAELKRLSNRRLIGAVGMSGCAEFFSPFKKFCRVGKTPHRRR